MSAINDLFSNVAEFRRYVPGISANIEFAELNSSAISARKQINAIITPALWNLIKSEEADSDAKEYLRNAFGNLIMHKSLIFDIISTRSSETAGVYKHEFEAMRRQYIDNYYNAMDSLIQELTENSNYSDAWKETNDYKLLQELQIQTTSEFDSYYGIDLSYLFFFRTIPLQREILLDGLGDMFLQVSALDPARTDLTSKLKLALSQMVVALALSRFDIIELPTTIRSLFDDQKSSRSGSEEQNRVLRLATDLRENAKSLISAVAILLSEPDNSHIVSETSFNKPDDKIYLMS